MTKRATKKQADIMADTIRGTVERLHCAYPTFSAGKLESQDRVQLVSFSAPVMLVQGARVIMTGRWTKDPKYGTQFQAATCEYDQTLDTEGLAVWLDKNTMIKGIGRSKARKIADAFGTSFDDVIMKEPEKIQALVNITDDQLALLVSTWKDHRNHTKLITWLAKFGLSINEIDKLIEEYGESTLGVLQSDPYQIIGKVPRVQFKKADEIALKMGIKKDHEGRITQGILWCVRDVLNDGSTYIEISELIRKANGLLGLDRLDSKQKIEEKIGLLIGDGFLVGRKTSAGVAVIMEPHIERIERFLADNLTFAAKKQSHIASPIDWNDKDSLTPRQASLNEHQRNATDNALKYKVSVTTGAAGTGKTHLVKGIIDYLEGIGKNIALCAPTGKAARRLAQTTNHDAKTIHRLLEYNPQFGFQRNEYEPLVCDLVIIDEFSMVDNLLAYHLFRAINWDTTSVLIIGDHNQLPPVGPGSLLRDLIASNVVPTTVLDTIVRQAGVLKANCSAILEGKLEKTSKPENGNIPWQVVSNLTDPLKCKQEICNGYEQILVNWSNANIITGIQILSPQRKGILGCDALNIALQKITQRVKWGVDIEDTPEGKRPKLYPHDKIIQVHNDYEVDVMNGTLGEIVAIEDNGTLLVQFEDYEEITAIPTKKRINIELAYCLTVHKTQGSQYPFVMLCLHKNHSFMHHRGIFYTGATRAMKKIIVLGDSWGIRNCVSKTEVDKRKTWFSELIKRE